MARFKPKKNDREQRPLHALREVIETVQQRAFALLPRKRRKVATLDWDSSNHEVYGEQRKGGFRP